MSIFSNLGIDNPGQREWIDICNKIHNGSPHASLEGDSIVLDTKLFHISDPRLLWQGHLPEFNFKYVIDPAHDSSVFIRCNEFHSFENFPESYNLQIIGDPSNVDWTTLECCKRVSIVLQTDNCEIKDVPVPITNLDVSIMDNITNRSDTILSKTSNCIFDSECKIQGNITDTNVFKTLFKKNQFIGPIIIQFYNPQDDFSFLDDTPCLVEKLIIIPKDYDPNSPVYEPIFRHSERYKDRRKVLRILPEGLNGGGRIFQLMKGIYDRGKDTGLIVTN